LKDMSGRESARESSSGWMVRWTDGWMDTAVSVTLGFFDW